MASTGFTGGSTTTYDDAMPPRSIFDPPTMEEYDDLSEDEEAWCNTTNASSYADTLTTRDTLSSNFTGSLSRRHHRQHHKHPSQMNEVELRVQLWDAYRLARIILGTPIKSTSLRGKTILQSIRKVAEMKLEMIRLQKELEMTKVFQDSQRSTASTIRIGPLGRKSSQSSSFNDPSSTLSIGGSSSLCDELNIQIANIIIPEEHNDSVLSTLRATSDDDDDEDGGDDYFENASFPTPRRRGKQGFSVEQQVELYKARYEALQATHEEILMELQEQLMEMQAQLQHTVNTTTSSSEYHHHHQHALHPGNGPSQKDQVMVPPTTVSLGRSSNTAPTDTTSGTSSTAFTDLTPMTTTTAGRSSLDSPDNAAGPSKPRSSSSSKSTAKKISKADDALDAVAVVARDYGLDDQTPEERHLRTVLAKPSHQVPERKVRSVETTSNTTNDMANSSVAEHEKLLQLIQQLMTRVEASSEETKAQFEELQEQLQSQTTRGKQQAPGGNAVSPVASMVVMQTQQQFQQRLQTAKTLHTLELETFKSKHAQQVQDLMGQLDAYRQQVQRQNVELQKWRRKYNHLESMVVTPGETLEVVQELQRISTPPHSAAATMEDHQRVHGQALRVLQRMAQLHVRQEKQVRLMQKTRALAKKREADTLEQLEDLKLQKELLEEDTQIPPHVWQRQLAQQRKAYEKEIKDIFKREERRMVEMERMEVDLTELAFMAVEIEDLEQEYKDHNEIYAAELVKARRQWATTAPLMQTLQAQARQLLVIQNKTLHDLDAAWAKGNETIQGPVLKRNTNPQEVVLQEREEELQRVKAELLKSQQRVRELEIEIKRG